MKRKNQKQKKFKFSKYKVIRNFIVIGILSLLFFTTKTQAYNNNINYKTIVVTNGETLWEIAKNEKENNEYFKNKDIRDIIKNIEKTNNLKNPTIYENQKLKIIEY